MELGPQTKKQSIEGLPGKLIQAAMKLAADSINHCCRALIRALNVMGTPVRTHFFTAYREIDRGQEACAIMKKKNGCKKNRVLRGAERKKKSTTLKKSEGPTYLAGGFNGVEVGAASKKKLQHKRAEGSTTYEEEQSERPDGGRPTRDRKKRRKLAEMIEAKEQWLAMSEEEKEEDILEEKDEEEDDDDVR